MTSSNFSIVVSIAGSDSSGGAGIQADIKTISALGCYAASIITALTAQNTHGVQAIYSVSPDFVRQQMESVFTDLSVSAIKIGMLHDENIIAVIADGIKKFKIKNIILDPVMVSKSGHELLLPQTLDVLKNTLLPLVTLITPNISEAEKLWGKKIQTTEKQQEAAVELGQLFQTNVLVKGGHLTDHQSSDVLYTLAKNDCKWFYTYRIATKNTHGTGCTLSSAIASFVAQNNSLEEAVFYAKRYLTHALDAAKNQTIGKGIGPVDHFYFTRKEYDTI
jgi:hydroxymethylpyrimidine/phosphomethylpyrimidine kinase